eukprot:TRINITY_DN4079_c0_g1_i1.p1 TRINITY_DN4079_c0_g1~~TRINITY_DN4079_c0_g1_i1.p1  ORF type:complete len:184 (-),score=47.46 TRINITY_DN4079_c0_g1_i1:23-574(-)
MELFKRDSPTPQPTMYDRVLKVVMIGNAQTGKSNLLSRFTYNTFSSNYALTMGVDFASKTTEVDGKKIKMQIWDTSGQESFKSITRSYYKGAGGLVIVYDVTNLESFVSVESLLGEVKEVACPKLLIGNKCDCVFGRKVTALQGEGLAEKHNVMFLETSALDSTNVNEAFKKLASAMLQGKYH